MFTFSELSAPLYPQNFSAAGFGKKKLTGDTTVIRNCYWRPNFVTVCNSLPEVLLRRFLSESIRCQELATAWTLAAPSRHKLPTPVAPPAHTNPDTCDTGCDVSFRHRRTDSSFIISQRWSYLGGCKSRRIRTDCNCREKRSSGETKTVSVLAGTVQGSSGAAVD